MTDDKQERIRLKAHEIWERSGRPDGQHEEHWQQASAEVDREDDVDGGSKMPEATVLENASPLDASTKRSRRAGVGKPSGSNSIDAKQSATGNEAEALRLAESSDLSPKQAKELLRKHRGNPAKVQEEAKNFKAES